MDTLQRGIWAGIMATGPHSFISRTFRPKNPLTSQLGYSVACGITYALVQKTLKGPPSVKGGIFGFGIWALSRYGWLSSLQSRQTARSSSAIFHKLVDLTSHVLWGIGLGLAEEKLRLHARSTTVQRRHQH